MANSRRGGSPSRKEENHEEVMEDDSVSDAREIVRRCTDDSYVAAQQRKLDKFQQQHEQASEATVAGTSSVEEKDQAVDRTKSKRPRGRTTNVEERGVVFAPWGHEDNGGGESDDFDVMKVVAFRSREAALQGESEEKVEEGGEYEDQMEEAHRNNAFPNKQGIPYHAMDGREPGAYSGAPGSSLHRCDDPRFSQVGVQPTTSSLSASKKSVASRIPKEKAKASQVGTGTVMEGTICSLVQASPIIEESLQDEELATAQPVDTQEKEEKEHNSQKERWWLLAGAVVAILCLVVSISLVYGSGGSSKGEASVSFPSFAPSMAASNVPSSTPTVHLEILRQSLPNSTLDNVYNFTTPQGKALLWMVSESELIGDMEVWRMKQLFALATFFYAFEGPHWPEPIRKDWLDLSKPECYWFSSLYGFLEVDGVWEETEGLQFEICDAKGQFENLDLADLRLENYNPVIPPEIAFLTNLKLLALSNAGITASLASQATGLVQLTNLKYLSLSNNNITGTIPVELGLMTNLFGLVLADNELTGTIPTQLGLMESLSVLSLEDNRLMGPIPSQLGLLSNLTELFLSNNTLTGTIPREVVSLAVNGSLNVVFVDGNQLSVTASDALCEDGNATAIEGELYFNCIGYDGDGLPSICSCQNLNEPF